jgi:hypothetical protein
MIVALTLSVLLNVLLVALLWSTRDSWVYWRTEAIKLRREKGEPDFKHGTTTTSREGK